MSDKKQLLSEALKRHKQILEYNFYIGEEGDKPEGEDVENLLFGSESDLTEQEEEPVADDPMAEPAMEEPMEDVPAEGGEELPEDPAMEEPMDMGEDPFGGDVPVEDEMADEPMDMGGEEQVEVDVTDIVDKAEEAKEEASQASSKIDDLLGKFGELESKLGGMDAIISKMDELEKEVIQRNPTPTEKLNMRSMDSFPYSVKLTDFWADKEGYDTGGEDEETEFNLTQEDIDSDYSETDIKDSFKLGKREE
jgi:hypothetical protein